MQSGAAILRDAFNQPTNLPLRTFAGLAGKSTGDIYADIDARLLLALGVGPASLRLPHWQLDVVKRRMTQLVLCFATDVDDWTIYRTLTAPLEGLGGLAPVDAVNANSIKHTAVAALNVLGVQIDRAEEALDKRLNAIFALR